MTRASHFLKIEAKYFFSCNFNVKPPKNFNNSREHAAILNLFVRCKDLYGCMMFAKAKVENSKMQKNKGTTFWKSLHEFLPRNFSHNLWAYLWHIVFMPQFSVRKNCESGKLQK